jgi:hypothetical protein
MSITPINQRPSTPFRDAAHGKLLTLPIAYLSDDLDAIEDFVMVQHPHDLRRLEWGDRYALIRKLGPKPPDADQSILDRRSIVATVLLMTQPYPENYAIFEEDLARTFLEGPGGERIRETYYRHLLLNHDDVVEFAKTITNTLADTFSEKISSSWPERPKTITTFSLSREDYKRLYDDEADVFPVAVFCYKEPDAEQLKKLPGLVTSSACMIAFNRHEIQAPQSGMRVAQLTAHEYLHMLVSLAEKSSKNAEIESAQNPFCATMPAIRQEMKLYDYIIKNFSETAYRCMMTERISYSFMIKLAELHKKNTCHSEIGYLSSYLRFSKPEWSKILGPRLLILDEDAKDAAVQRSPFSSVTLRRALL